MWNDMTREREVRAPMRQSKTKVARRKRLAPRINAQAVAPPLVQEPQELPLDLFLEDDDLGTSLDEAVETDSRWDTLDVPEEEIDDPISDAPALQDLQEGDGDLEDEHTGSGMDNPVLLYLQEAGTVPLLKPEDEVRIAKQIVALKARLREVVEESGPRLPEALSVETTTPTEAEDWVTEVVHVVRSWVSRIE